MKNLMLLFVMLTVICSCKKNASLPVLPPQPPVVKNDKPPKYKVTFIVAGFTKTVTPINTSLRNNALTPNVTVLPADDKYYPKIMYMVYDSAGTQVSRLEENLSPDEIDKLFRIENNSRQEINNSTSFGKITDSLKAGNYTLVITAGTQRGGMNNPMEFWKIPLAGQVYPDNPLAEAKFYPANDHNPFFMLMDDAFVYKAPLKVSAADLEQTITPERVVGKVLVTITDAIPEQTSYLRIYVDNELYYYNIDKAKAEGIRTDLASNYYGVYNNWGQVNHTFSFKVLNTENPFSVKIESYKGLDKITSKTIPNITVNKGQTVQIATKLFQ